MCVRRKMLSILLAIATIALFTFGSAMSVFAADTVSWATPKDKTATALDSNNQTKVTLSLPSAEYNSKADVVFVLDKSTSGNLQKCRDAAKAMVKKLADKNNVDVKVGVVLFNYNATENLPLTKLDSSSVKTIDDAIDSGSGHGSNTQGGLLAADKMLSAKSEQDVSDSNKYVVFVSDGIGYYWSDDNGNAESIYTASSGLDGATSFETVVAQEYHNRLGKGFNAPTYDEIKTGSATISDGTVKNKIDFTSDAHDLITNPNHIYTYNINDKDLPTGGAQKLVPGKEVAQVSTSVERSVYLTNKEYTKLAKKYNCTDLYWSLGTSKDGPEYTICYDLMKDLANIDNSGYDITNFDEATIANAFDSIENKIIYALNSGKVTDTITDSFDLVQSEVPFTLTVGGKEMTGVKTGDNKYAFGSKDEKGNYPYTVEFTTSKTFVWTINVPIENSNPAQLSYKLQLHDLTKSGTFTTNVSATLDAKDSNGDITAQNDPFPIPSVSYVANNNSGKTNNNPSNGNSSNNSGKTNNSSSNSNSSKPDTGDNALLGMWLLLGTTSMLLAGTLVAARRRTE